MSPATKPPSPRLPGTEHQRESKGRPSEDHVATKTGEGNVHNRWERPGDDCSHGEGPAEVEGLGCSCPACHLT